MEKREELQQEKKKWLEEVYGKICTKMSAECTRVGDRIPYIPENGRYEGDLAESCGRCIMPREKKNTVWRLKAWKIKWTPPLRVSES